jgi:hypothetical protein
MHCLLVTAYFVPTFGIKAAPSHRTGRVLLAQRDCLPFTVYRLLFTST